MNHLLIAGGTGFIGFHLATKIKKEGWKVTSVSLSKPKKYRRIKGVKYILVDLTQEKQIRKKFKDRYTHVVNLSGITQNLYSQKLRKKIFKSHFNGTKNLINFFLNKKLKNFIQIGSSAEYGSAKSPLMERKKCKPTGIYGKAKLQATIFTLKSFRKYNFPANILRLFQVYGPNQGYNRAIMQILNYCINKKKFPVSDGKQIRDFCFIDDVIRAIILTLKKNFSGKIINIAYGKGISMKKLIILIQKVAKGGEPQFGLFKTRDHENKKLVPSIKLANKLLKWRPRVDLEQGLEKTRKFIIKHGY